jgi:hypothetical protein
VKFQINTEEQSLCTFLVLLRASWQWAQSLLLRNFQHMSGRKHVKTKGKIKKTAKVQIQDVMFVEHMLNAKPVCA